MAHDEFMLKPGGGTRVTSREGTFPYKNALHWRRTVCLPFCIAMNALATAAPFTARLPTARSCRLPARRSGLSVSAMSTTGDSGATHKHTGRRQSVSLGTAAAPAGLPHALDTPCLTWLATLQGRSPPSTLTG